MLAQRLHKLPWQVLEEVTSSDISRVALKFREVGAGRVTGFLFEVVGDIAQESQPLLRGPEEGVGHDFPGIRALFGVSVQHTANQVLGLGSKISKDIQWGKVVVALANVDFAHVPIAAIEGVQSIGQNVEENQSQAENVNGTSCAPAGHHLRIHQDSPRAAVDAGFRKLFVVINKQLRGTPSRGPGGATGRCAKGRLGILELLTEAEVRHEQAGAAILIHVDEDVLGLQVAVNDAELVQMVDAVGDLIQYPWQIGLACLCEFCEPVRFLHDVGQ